MIEVWMVGPNTGVEYGPGDAFAAGPVAFERRVGLEHGAGASDQLALGRTLPDGVDVELLVLNRDLLNLSRCQTGGDEAAQPIDSGGLEFTTGVKPGVLRCGFDDLLHLDAGLSDPLGEEHRFAALLSLCALLIRLVEGRVARLEDLDQ